MWAKSGIQVATVLGDDKVQGMIIGGRGGNEAEVSFVGIETDRDLRGQVVAHPHRL